MNDLICKSDDCESVVSCEEGVSSVTCSYCCATIGTSSCSDQYISKNCDYNFIRNSFLDK